MSLVITGITVIDGVSERPMPGRSIWIEDGRIKSIGSPDHASVPPGAEVIDGRGKYAIAGLMNANVHLLGDIRFENLTRYMDQYEDLILEAAQVALKGGITTVFDTWGPRRYLMAARDQIKAKEAPGSRIFCAGNIVGFDGPLSEDFLGKAVDIASSSLIQRLNAIWVENVGRHLMWLTPDEVRKELRDYIGKGINFVKYASNEHGNQSAGAFLQFSEKVQAAIVDEAHKAGITAQAHCMSVEGLRIALEAGCDLITHCNITGPAAIPESTLELFVKRKTGAVIFPWTQKGLEWVKQHVSDMEWTIWKASDTNARNLISIGAPLLMANDGTVFSWQTRSDPAFSRGWDGAPGEDGLREMATGHFAWFRAMEEKGCKPIDMLRAATRNVAVAYGMERDFGTLEESKIADILLLEKNPLEEAENYRSICAIIQDGQLVDADSLPLKPILTKSPEGPMEEERCYRPAFHTGARYPICPLCMGH